MQLDFRIDWGYSYFYSRRHYHPIYEWDGHIEVTGGSIMECRQLHYPKLWCSPGHSATETPLPQARWRDRTRRGLSGVRIFAAADGEATEFTLITMSGTFRFTAGQLLAQGRIVFPAGPKYLGCHVIVTQSGYYWFHLPAQPGQTVWEVDDLALPVRDWARIRTVWLAPGAGLDWDIEAKPPVADFSEALLHLKVMGASAYTPGREGQVHGVFPFRLECDGECVAQGAQYLRMHDVVLQMLEDIWLRFPVTPGRHRLRFTNLHPEYSLLICRIDLRHCVRSHLQLSLPQWALCREKLIGSIFAAHPDTVEVRWPGGKSRIDLIPGWNEFTFSLPSPGTDIQIYAGDSAGVIPAVYDLPEEDPPVTVGFDMTVVPHDEHGFMDWILNYAWRTRLGNLVVFRGFLLQSQQSFECRPVAAALLEKWGAYGREHGMHIEAATDFDDGALIRGAGKALHSVGRHEWPGAVYARDPAEPWCSRDMREAMEHYLKYLRIEIDRAHRVAARAAFGDASGGHRYCYLAGCDFLRSETMVPHTQHLCSQARPAAESLGSGEWGVHIAVQHAFQPFFPNHLGVYFLSLFQPWLMGASMIYEEDSLFLMFKEERQSWDDALPQAKREMTREFFRFVKTHPRHAPVRRYIGFIEGRYAAPFNGFICDGEQTPDYSVWGYFGNPAPEWGHRQPEKCRQLLDVLMPGASTHPLRQRFDRRRFYFSGTPYGDFDELPVEASLEYFQNYKLLLHLGWNTMIPSDYTQLEEYVKSGGTLLIGIPQFSTHTRRDFLRDMSDLALFRNGDLTTLCGFKVKGPGKRYSGQWNAAGRECYPEPKLAGLPNCDITEDGPCLLAEIELAGAEVVAWDADSAAPVVTSFRLGKGCVYCFTAWVYPGHEQFQPVAASFLAALCDRYKGDISVRDSDGEIFWNIRDHGSFRLLSLLNTDWTAPGNVKHVEITTPGVRFETDIMERRASFVAVFPDCAVEYDQSIHLDHVDGSRLKLYGSGVAELIVHRPDRRERCTVDFGTGTEVQWNIERRLVEDGAGVDG